jgi:hypothetical protein
MARGRFLSQISFFQEVLKPMLLWKADLYFMNPLSKVSLAKSYIRFKSDRHVAMEECIWLQVFEIVFA